MKRLGMIELHRRQGDGVTRILIPAEMVGPVAEVPGNDTTPPQCRVTLRGRSYWEDILVLDTIDEVRDLYSAVLAGPYDPIFGAAPPPASPHATEYEHEHAWHPEAVP